MISGELQKINDEIKEFRIFVASSDEEIKSAHEVSKRYDDLTYRLNILAFESKLEAARLPDGNSLATAAIEIIKLPTFMHQSSSEYKNCIEQASRLLAMIPKSAAVQRTPEKRLEDIAFQNSILLYHVNSESAKLKPLFGEAIVSRFNVISASIQKVIDLTKNSSEEASLPDIVHLLKSVSEALYKEAVEMKELGGAVMVLSNEFKWQAEVLYNLK